MIRFDAPLLRWFLFCVGCSISAGAAEPLTYNRDIRPILSENCFACHGPDQAKRKSGLRLDVREVATQPAKSGGIAIVPGKADASEAVLRIFSADTEEQMPPPDSGHKLTAAQKELLRRWIAEGAAYQRHWAFEPIRQIPATGNAIDFFIHQGLKQVGLKPSPAASPEMQLRRVSLDLTGLPPTSDETNAFVTDLKQRGLDAAYETTVDRFLKSPRYGERMAWQWLEAARYADTDGYQNDGPREMWRWRDWVIEAFNANMPFNQFTIEQLAGDLLPNPTHEQLIATGFNRNHRYNSEEGIPIDEFLLENAVDRVDTTATVWMGLTAGCARCHDHKFDPLTQAEYYSMIDYFNDVAESGRATRPGNSEPWIKTPTSDQRTQLAKLEKKVAAARQALEQAAPAIAEARRAWEKKLVAEPAPAFLTNGLEHYFSFDAEDKRVTAKDGEPTLGEGRFGTAATLTGAGHFEVGQIPGLIGNGRFSIGFWMKPGDVAKGPVLSNETATTLRSGILVEFVDGHLRWNINTRWISGVSTVETVRTFRSGEWVHVALTNDGTRRAAGMIIYVDGEPQAVRVIRNTNSNPARRTDGAAMSIGYSKHVGAWKGQVDELRFYPARTLPPEEVAMLAEPHSLSALASRPEDGRTGVQIQLLQTAFLEDAAPPEHKALLGELRKAEAARLAYYDKLPTTMIMADLPEGRPSFIRVRGVYDQFGARVQPGVPAALPPLPKDTKNDRLAFARWLVNPQHPLTARVAVNRYWQLLFGRGFVNTAEDFGSQGELPSHPELLDWLASDFMADGWNIKALMKRIVLSATYRQDSNLAAEHRLKDPDNRWFARAPRVRLPGNVLRDQAFLVAGLLVEQRGGPSVFAYQPDGLWEEASNATYKVGKGADLYRRSLYTYWKRTLAPPTMALLDAGDREYCSVKPKHTNTPLQALTLMNEETFVEAARKLAARMLTEGGDSDEARITFAFRLVATRAPTPQELLVLVAALADYRREFEAHPMAAPKKKKTDASPAAKSLPQVELAAATALANVLLNLDEVTTRD
ncbi:MAG: DUF1553 domain-containing protein [Opitutus sp.]|nr:DUF1553 domain-containing protein [Opitutus sp.]